jgi:hypothetical protein
VRSRLLLAFGFALGVLACSDLRDFRGAWQGPRIGDDPSVRVGVSDDANAELSIEAIDGHGLTGTLAISGLVPTTALKPIAGAEADVLAGMTFSGGPLRVYLAFAAAADPGGDAIAMIALYDDRRIEVRILRGGSVPVYAIFSLTET